MSVNPVMFKKLWHTNNMKKIVNHLKYIGFRSQDIYKDQHYGHFGPDSDRVDFNEFVDRLEKHKALKNPRSIKAQSLVISLKEVDYEVYKRTGKDYRDLTRDWMDQFQKRMGYEGKLDWVANIHEKDKTPHVHIVLKSVTDVPKSKKSDRIVLRKDDFLNLRSDFGRIFLDQALDHYTEKDYAKLNLERYESRHKDLEEELSKDIGNLVKALAKSIEKERKKGEREKDMNHGGKSPSRSR